MSRSDPPQPLLKTPEDKFSKVEKAKLAATEAIAARENSYGVYGTLQEEFRNDEPDIAATSSEIAKTHGIYLEYNRAKSGKEKDWMYMVRISVRGGGTLNREQWRILDEAANKYGNANPYGGPSLRLTTRQNVQFHWVKKSQVLPLIQDIAKTGFFTLNGCGDNTRNVMGCPLSAFSDIFNANAKAHEYGKYFQLPVEPHVKIFALNPNEVRDETKRYDYGPKLLNRKFKIGFSAVHRNEETGILEPDNCVELRTNEVGVAPIVNPQSEKVEAYYLYIGGGQGEKNGKSSFTSLGTPFGVFTEDNLMQGLHDIVKVHEEWGDRKNRHWARLKYVIENQGVEWYRQKVRERGSDFELPDPDFDPGPRKMHHGWTKLPDHGPGAGKLAYGAYIECGRLVDTADDEDPDHRSGNVTGNGRVKSMVRDTLDSFDGVELMVTPNQDALFVNIDPDAKEEFEAKLAEYGYGQRRGKPYSRLRLLSGACVGLPTCRLSYTDSEQFEPELLDQLDEMGYGDMNESVGITGCERQCFRPATKTIGWVGQGPNMYGLKLGGSEDGRHQGLWLADDEKWYLRQTSRELVPVVTAALFDHYLENRQDGEDMGTFHRRLGPAAIIRFLKENPDTAPATEKTFPAPFQLNATHGVVAAK